MPRTSTHGCAASPDHFDANARRACRPTPLPSSSPPRRAREHHELRTSFCLSTIVHRFIPQTDERSIHNPVSARLPPDPSILRVGADYYIATSTFEWWPACGCTTARPAALAADRPRADAHQPARDARQPDSGGIWAPCLSWRDGVFPPHLHQRAQPARHAQGHAQLPRHRAIHRGAPGRIRYLNSSGFDPSLFHDDDGRSWLLGVQWDHRPGHHPSRHPAAGSTTTRSGASSARVDASFPRQFRCASPRGTPPDATAGTSWSAEGGTYYEHAVTVARSRHITLRTEPASPAAHRARRRAGRVAARAVHASLVETDDGQCFWRTCAGGRSSGATMRPPSRRPTTRSMRCTARSAARPPLQNWPGMRTAGRAWRMATNARAEVGGPRPARRALPPQAELDDFDAPRFRRTGPRCVHRQASGCRSTRGRATCASSAASR